MTLLKKDIEAIDSHWAVEAVGAKMRQAGLLQADGLIAESALRGLADLYEPQSFDLELIERLATAYEVAAIEGIEATLHPSSSEKSKKLQLQTRAGAYRAFSLIRSLPFVTETNIDEERIFHVLHLAGLAYCGDRWTDLQRLLRENDHLCAIPSTADASWDKRILINLYDGWIRLLRKDGWDDIDKIKYIIIRLREEQKQYENIVLKRAVEQQDKSIAIRLISLYHWAKATESLSKFMLQGTPPAIDVELDQHFEAAIKAIQRTQDYQLEMILRWLHVASRLMVKGSLWRVAHSVNSRVTKFVELVTKKKGLFELLPPQRMAILENGLLDQANRAVVVDMPTSGGKTALAQFRILQALNQFSESGGWVAYVAPTRALVSQITRRLRKDFFPLGINVNQLSGAVEIDAFEQNLLSGDSTFHVLVATPEKLQLVFRNNKTTRPLSLIVMDEAHNIEDEERGLRIELLLASTKQKYPFANFLLLMPFVPNAKDLAQWLAADAGKTVSLSSSIWQPNERIVGMFSVKQFRGEDYKEGDWSLDFETLTTTQNSINLKGIHKVGDVRPLKRLNYSNAKGVSVQAGAMAKVFSSRGTSIIVTQTIPHAWSLARKLEKELPALNAVTEEISLVQRFLQTEISKDFELIEMLSKGIGVHHAGLPAEAQTLIEWLTEIGQINILCATTTIAQGLNFPVSSVFLATRKFPYGKEMSHRAFWNLAGRAGRIDHGSVGIVGIAAGDNPNEIRSYVSEATEELISRLVGMLDELERTGRLLELDTLIYGDQWADFRSYIAHLWNEKKQLDIVISETEQLLRSTYGYSSLRSKGDQRSTAKAEIVLEATKKYVYNLSEHPENALLADSTGFSPEGVRTALLELNNLESKLNVSDWEPSTLFGNVDSSALPSLVGVMMKIPQLRQGLDEIKGSGNIKKNIAKITSDWVSGKSIESIAREYFEGKSDTDRISKACKAVYRDLANCGAWGLSALSKMPTSGIDFEQLGEDQLRKINNLPAMLYHGVRTEEAVLMRMNSVPRSIAESLGVEYSKKAAPEDRFSSTAASVFLQSLKTKDWEQAKPKGSHMTGRDYQSVWMRLSGLS